MPWPVVVAALRGAPVVRAAVCDALDGGGMEAEFVCVVGCNASSGGCGVARCDTCGGRVVRAGCGVDLRAPDVAREAAESSVGC